mgnify:CR=1 FL=1
MKQYDIGIDLGTTSIIIATEEQGVVFRQPTIGAVDTRTNTIIAVGDEARLYRPCAPPAGRRHPGPSHDQ